MSEKAQPGDRVRVSYEAQYLREQADGRPLLRDVESHDEYGAPYWSTVEVIERADDPTIGEIRRADGAADGKPRRAVAVGASLSEHPGERFVWVVVETGEVLPDNDLAVGDVIGAVPGTPAARSSGVGAEQPLPEWERDLLESGKRAEDDGYTKHAGPQCGCDSADDVRCRRPLWTGDGSEEPPPYVTKVSRPRGRTVERNGDGWNWNPTADATPWQWDGDAMVERGPYTEVRGD